VVDLHCHILPGLDDGPAQIGDSLELARAAERAGITRIAATPHVREDYPFDPLEIEPRVRQLNVELGRAAIGLEVVSGAELGITKARELDDDTVSALCLGTGAYLLVESPYTQVTDLLEQEVFELQLRGFRPVLAHPERSPSFLGDARRLAVLAERGVLCSVTAGSLAGRFGGSVQRFALELFAEGLVHNVASDAHDSTRRPPDLTAGLAALEAAMSGASEAARWYTEDVPAAILAGADLPGAPPVLTERRGWPGRLRRRARPRRS
jgi:protein-tyrosine phosphatase